MSEAALEPCPFCGRAAEEVTIETCVSPFYAIRCANPRCRISPWTGYRESKQEALDAWDMRHGCIDEPQDDELLECLHADCSEELASLASQAESRAKGVAKAICSDCREIGVERVRDAMIRGIDAACGHIQSSFEQETLKKTEDVAMEVPMCSQKSVDVSAPMGGNVRSWYLSFYPEDPLGSSIKEDASFDGVLRSLSLGEDLVCAVGISEGTVRNRVFGRIAELSGHPTSDVYNLWATCGRVNAFGDVLGEHDSALMAGDQPARKPLERHKRSDYDKPHSKGRSRIAHSVIEQDLLSSVGSNGGCCSATAEGMPSPSYHDRSGKRLTVGDYVTIDGRSDFGVVEQLFEDDRATMCRIHWETFEEVHPCSCVQIEGRGHGIHDSWLALSCDIEEHVSKAGNDIDPDVAKAWAWRATALSAIEKGTGGL